MQLIETKKVVQEVKQDRRMYLDFVVLKNMKRLKLCPFDQLMDEIVPQLMFGLQKADL